MAVILITVFITILLFSFQYHGTDKVSFTFGPIMLLWFAALLLTGIYSILQAPQVLSAINPWYAIDFLLHHGLVGFFVLSEVILCATGGEALYADMGHLGGDPIKHAWYFVFFALVINYFGQGAYLLNSGDYTSILFSMVRSMVTFLYVPFLILTLLATIIASQAMISAIMSLVYQGITTRVFPLLKVNFTSSHLKSQIYIGVVNWALLIAVIFMIFFFQKSENIAAAYGLAVTATMTISSIFMIWIFKIDKNYKKMAIACFTFVVVLSFLIAVMNKIPHGGYWSLVIAAVPFLIIKLWERGNKRMHRSFRPLPIDTFIISYNQIYGLGTNIKGTALFFAKSLEEIPPYMVHCIIRGNIIYENNILVSIRTTDKPYGVNFQKVENIAHGLSGIIVEGGYLEVLDIPALLKKNGINEKVIFYGVEDISTNKPLLKIFAFMKKITPSFVKFYTLPYNKLHGVETRLEL
jgi:KUP system potassium uptake protein